MVLRYSYGVQVKKLESEILALRLSFARHNDSKFLERIESKQKEKEWFEGLIKEGKDTGVYAL